MPVVIKAFCFFINCRHVCVRGKQATEIQTIERAQAVEPIQNTCVSFHSIPSDSTNNNSCLLITPERSEGVLRKRRLHVEFWNESKHSELYGSPQVCTLHTGCSTQQHIHTHTDCNTHHSVQDLKGKYRHAVIQAHYIRFVTFIVVETAAVCVMCATQAAAG